MVAAGWDVQTQIREEVGFTKGRIIVRGGLVTRGKAKRADYVLYYKHLPLALIEAKDQTRAIADGTQQALGYAATLDIPYVFSSNGKGFQLHDRTGTSEQLEQSLAMDRFPSPTELWDRYRRWKRFAPEQESAVLQANFDEAGALIPHKNIAQSHFALTTRSKF
nr:type I restriction endonuclease [Rhodanobacter sp. MP7CTX1]